ncbi:hypothetical protein EON77_02825 [bacterium]|nr:MAG: hypothetical protein EON77_02825 [bacterium]
MKPGAFAILLLLLITLGAAGGGITGYALHAPNPLTAAKPNAANAEGLATNFLRGIVGTEAIDAAYEDSRRQWAAGGLGMGALLGLLSAVAIGSYSLRYRAVGR